ncbi:MAG: TrbI/VirB10 family protein, partial [Verrucomicrobiales bacterium]|nr:TrbI/VirB10 family protein [Verrucomicrobiales bacterium]
MLAALQKPAVQIVLFGTVIAFAVGFFYMKDQRAAPSAVPAEPPPKNMGQAATTAVTVSRDELQSSETTETARIDKLVLPVAKPEPPTLVAEKPKPKEKPKPPVFPDLVQMTAPARPKPFVPQPPKVFAPRGTLIKATLVITLESNAIGTPVLALVNEDVYFQGNLIVPAGTQVQAAAAAGSKFRDRIDVRGTFTFIWADGSEYVINGIALDHQP